MSSVQIKLQFRRIAESLAAQAIVAAGTGHASTTGRIREILVKQFLEPHLPRTFSVRSGVIVDSEELSSKQQDCVIIDNRLPLVDIGSDDEAVLISESVVATIEVKSHLGTTELQETLDAIAITKQLCRKGEQIYRKGPVEIRIPKPHPILAYIFAYDGLSINAIAEHIAEFAHKHKDGAIVPEGVCILKEGVVLRTQLMPVVKGSKVTLPPLKESKLTTQILKKDALLAFYRRLVDDVIPLRMVNIDIDGYYNASDLE